MHISRTATLMNVNERLLYFAAVTVKIINSPPIAVTNAAGSASGVKIAEKKRAKAVADTTTSNSARFDNYFASLTVSVKPGVRPTTS